MDRSYYADITEDSFGYDIKVYRRGAWGVSLWKGTGWALTRGGARRRALRMMARAEKADRRAERSRTRIEGGESDG